MGTNLRRGLLAFAVFALLATPTVALADVTPAPVVAPTAPPVVDAACAVLDTAFETPSSHVELDEQLSFDHAREHVDDGADPRGAEEATRDAEEGGGGCGRQAGGRRACREDRRGEGEGRGSRQAKIDAARTRSAALVAAQKKAAAERARIVSQQQHAEDTAEATFTQALQRDDAFRFSTTAAESIGASAAVQAAPMGAADATAGSKAFATSPTSAPPIPMFAAVAAAIALAAAAAYAVRSRAWRVVR